MDTEKIKTIIAPLIESYNLVVTHLAFMFFRSGPSLRVDVDHKLTGPVPRPYPGSRVDIKVLESLSREIAAAVEAAFGGGEKFSLEVSSPGLGRPIAGPGEYPYFLGHMLKIQLRLPLDGRRNFKGTLTGVEPPEGAARSLTLELEEGGQVRLEIDAIESARLSVELPAPMPKHKKKGK